MPPEDLQAVRELLEVIRPIMSSLTLEQLEQARRNNVLAATAFEVLIRERKVGVH